MKKILLDSKKLNTHNKWHKKVKFHCHIYFTIMVTWISRYDKRFVQYHVCPHKNWEVVILSCYIWFATQKQSSKFLVCSMVYYNSPICHANLRIWWFCHRSHHQNFTPNYVGPPERYILLSKKKNHNRFIWLSLNIHFFEVC